MRKYNVEEKALKMNVRKKKPARAAGSSLADADRGTHRAAEIFILGIAILN
jgi:hypothetical protein